MSAKASTTRTIHFTSKGGSYTAIWMGSKGDLYQEYSQNNGSTQYYPEITPTDPIVMKLTVTSARSSGTVTPQSIVYCANGVELAFNSAKACTTTGFTNIFKLDADNNLMIIGNLGNIVLGSFLLQAKVSMSSAAGSDTITVNAPVTVAPYLGADHARVTIASPDNKNFTIDTKGGSCQLKALTYKGGVLVTAGLSYEWFRFSGTAFVSLGVTTQTLTVQEASVDSYGLYKVVVKESGVELGFDIQGVLDASDPYDVVVSSYINDGAGGNDVATNDLTLNDEMPSSAYLKFVPKMVRRGDASATAVTGSILWSFAVVAGNGAKVFGQAASAVSFYKLTVGDLLTHADAIGDYELIIEGELT